MDEQQPISPRRRMQILQAIPDSERTDEEWDELNELEIMFAPGNRVGAGGEPDRRVTPSSTPAARKRAARGPGAQARKAPVRKPAKKTPKGGGRGGGNAGGGNPGGGNSSGGNSGQGGGAAGGGSQ